MDSDTALPTADAMADALADAPAAAPRTHTAVCPGCGSTWAIEPLFRQRVSRLLCPKCVAAMHANAPVIGADTPPPGIECLNDRHAAEPAPAIVPPAAPPPASLPAPAHAIAGEAPRPATDEHRGARGRWAVVAGLALAAAGTVAGYSLHAALTRPQARAATAPATAAAAEPPAAAPSGEAVVPSASPAPPPAAPVAVAAPQAEAPGTSAATTPTCPPGVRALNLCEQP